MIVFNRKLIEMDGGWMGIHAPKTLNSEKPFLDFGLWIFDNFQDEKDAQRNLEQDGGL